MSKKINKAMILTIACRSWNYPKHILVETDAKSGEYVDDVAQRAFKKYKSQHQNKDIYLVTYAYYGDIEVAEYTGFA